MLFVRAICVAALLTIGALSIFSLVGAQSVVEPPTAPTAAGPAIIVELAPDYDMSVFPTGAITQGALGVTADTDALLWFDCSQVPGTVVSATLSMFLLDFNPPAVSNNVCPLDTYWDESFQWTSFGSGGPVLGSPCSTLSLAPIPARYSVDVTDLVKAGRCSLAVSTDSGGAFYASGDNPPYQPTHHPKLTVQYQDQISSKARLTVTKVIVGSAPSADWQFQTHQGSFALPGSGGTTTISATLGSVTISETLPEGWTAQSSCSNGAVGTHILHTTIAGDSTCTFTNTQLSEIGVVKNTVGGDGAFDFNGKGVDDFTLTTVGGSTSISMAVQPGDYGISEDAVSGWALLEQKCSDGSDPANFTMGPGDKLTCSFTNYRLGNLSGIVNQFGSGAGVPNVTVNLGSSIQGAEASYPEYEATAITDAEGKFTFNDVPVGNYDICFTVPSDYDAVPCSKVTVNAGQTTTVPTLILQKNDSTHTSALHLPYLQRQNP